MESQFRELEAQADVEYWQKQSQNLSRAADWEKLQEINTRFGRDIKLQTRKYNRDYAKRFERACKQIAHRRGERFEKLKRRKDPRSQQLTRLICKAAHQDIETDQRRRIAALRERQGKELRVLIETARDRDAGPQAPKLLTDDRNSSDRRPFTRSR